MKREPTSLAKTTRPNLSGVFPRTRLYRLLDRGRRRAILWVTGPPGSGKTTLVASYLDARKLPGIWYQVDAGDADVATFFYYMRLAARQAAPRYRKPLPLLTPEYLPELYAFTRRYFEDLYDRLRLPFVMIFDDYQEVPTLSPLHQVIRDGLSQLPERGNIIVISRNDPPLTLTRLRASGAMEVIDWDKLRLTIEESYGIARLRRPQRVSRETIQHLHVKTDGWAAGLILMLEGAVKEGLPPPPLGVRTPELIFHYFASEIFQRVDKETQDFLLKTAFLDKMTARMTEQLTGLHRADRTLSDLHRRNYFTDVRSLPEPVYQYHPLFREFLLTRANETFAPETLAQAQRKAAAILEGVGGSKRPPTSCATQRTGTE